MILNKSNQILSAAARADIQGFLTSGFAHLPSTAYVFIRFDEQAQAKQWLRQLAATITTAESWRKKADAPKVQPSLATNIGLTIDGLRFLGLPESCVETFPSEFREGMASENSSRDLGDTGPGAPINWSLGGPTNQPIHAILILHAQTETALHAECEHIDVQLKAFAGIDIVAREFGNRPPNSKEPFGFRDGIAQPQIKGIKGEGVSTGEFLLGYPNEYGFLPVSPMLPVSADPGNRLPDSANPFFQGYRDLGSNGSFLVYRKLEQDVAGFWNFMRAESERRLGVRNPLFMVRLASKMVGRWPSGAPLSLAPECDNPELRDADNFCYAAIDSQGFGCPFGAHIRRSNPRDQLLPAGPLESQHMTLRHRILRRGKPYGRPLFDLNILDNLKDRKSLQTILNLRPDNQPRGIHFLCINASIRSQFQFIQQVWCNNPHFNGLTNNPDPVTGTTGVGNSPDSMFLPQAGVPVRTAELPRLVTVRGGSYFFVPGLRALRWLAE